ncbi:sensor histidine kinase [Sphingomonas jatrophae]|uniref:sensor histidine kinase n=1 Tax=Sphingomonas jatrophae TaxID=1166337 RepID=UPI000B8699AC|nr:HAMP domain-containing sensor histidine kinase [Sphingomonas jatrophae]
MRYDDMLATLLRQPLDTRAARVTAWRQAVDMLAQGRGGTLTDHAFDMLRHLRGDVPAEVRREAAGSIVGRSVPASLVRLFAEEPPAIAAPALAGARLAPEEWVALLPDLGPTARGFVRNRRDLAPSVVQALEAFGAHDLALDGPVSLPAEAPAEIPVAPPAEPPVAPAADPVPDPTPGPAQISEVLGRIEAFRARRSEPPPAPTVPDSFRFETDGMGEIVWTDAPFRGGLIGETIARAAGRDGVGVDGHAAGAFRRRAPFRDARLALEEGAPFGGAWRISAVPAFDEASGRFTGYRGVARRPRADESAEPLDGGAFAGFHPDSLRQLVHELRTPINAIIGFAELIERQLLGPAGSNYRERAGEIVGEGQRLLDAVEDLDAAAKMAGRRWTLDEGAVEGAALVTRLADEIGAPARARGVTLTVETAALPPIAADPPAVERMIARLLQSVLAVAAPGETMALTLRAADGGAELSVTRPALLSGRDERTLLDPGYAPDGDWPDAPLLGLGFALRLVRNLASGARGALDIQPDRFRLRLPVRRDSAGAGTGRG